MTVGLSVDVPAAARLLDEGSFDATVRIDPPTYASHNPVNPKRYVEQLVASFEGVRLEIGHTPSPQAQPRGETASTPPGLALTDWHDGIGRT